MKFIKFFLSFSFVFLLTFVACPFASASEAYNIPFSQPQVADGSGYMEVLFESSGGSRYVRLFQWQTTPSTQMIGTEKILTNITVNSNGLVNIEFDYPESTFYAVVSIYDGRWSDSGYFEIWQDVSVGSEIAFNLDYDDDIVSFNIYGNYTNFTSDLVAGYLPKFTVTYGDDTSLSDLSSSLVDINNKLLQLHNDNLIVIEDLEYIQTQISNLVDSFHADLSLLLDELYVTNTWLDYISDQLNDFSDRMHSDSVVLQESAAEILYNLKLCLSELDSIDNRIYSLSYWLKNTFYSKWLTLSNYLQDRIEKIWEVTIMIYKELIKEPEQNLESPDTSEMDGYIDAENDLLQNDVDVNEVVQVEVNQNALSFIWSLVQKIFDSNGKVFGMVLTVLSLGLVAMVLGRKV